MSLTKIDTGRYILTHRNVTPGHSLAGVYFRISTTFLDIIYKLVKFRILRITCKLDNSDTKKIVEFRFRYLGEKNVLRYLLGHSNTLPLVTNDYMEFMPGEVENGVFSNVTVPYEERYFNNLIRFINGSALTFSTSSYGCFSPPGNSINGLYQMYVI